MSAAPFGLGASYTRRTTSTNAPAIVGRETELESIERFLDALPAGPSGVLISGEAGIGKTTLWLASVNAATVRSYRVIQARPAESEASLSYAVLADLVGDIFDELGGTLPAPQKRALGAAFLRTEINEGVDPRTTATALVSVLVALAAESPVLLALDDVQWIDRASARALEFAARRLPAPVGVLVTKRTEDESDVPLGLARALPENRMQQLVPGPLSLAALHHLIAGRLQAVPSRPTLARIADASRGNPFFALEIASVLESSSNARELGDPLPLSESLEELVLARVRALPVVAQEAVLVAAALSRPTVAAVSETLMLDDALSVLVDAEEAGVLVIEHERIAFTHPLLASAVYGAASDSRRRELHARLADVVADPEEHARHRAASATGIDEATADELEHAARGAALRGAHDAAAELLAASCRLTPRGDSETFVRRTLREAVAVHQTGDLAAARALAERAVADSTTPALRVEALMFLVRIEWDAGGVEFERLDESLAAAADDRGLQRDVCVTWVGSLRTLDPRRALAFAERVDALSGGDDNPSQVEGGSGVDRGTWMGHEHSSSFLLDRFWAEVLLGRKPRRELLERGLKLEASIGPMWPIPILWFTGTDDFDAARARHDIEDAWWRDRGDDRMRADRLAYRAIVELRAGRWDFADEFAERSCALLDGIDLGRAHAVAFGWRSLVDAHRGRLERARSTLVWLLEEAERKRAQTWWIERLLAILGFVEFSAGDHEAADRAFMQMRAKYDLMGVTEPLLDWSEPAQVESLLALGELEQARKTLIRLEERARRLPRLWIDVTLPRTRALVLAAEGDPAAALTALDDLDFEVAQLPFELGWASLVKGRLLRRLKQRRAAAATLHQAVEVFEGVGAPAWAEQTRAELARVGPRRRAPDELTATELRVAELAATGLTNREVAKAAFISSKTVEANLARVYRKLGIRSRAELGARMRDGVSAAKIET